MRPVAIRLYHLTFYKCGSQWVRDILADPRIVQCSHHTLAAGGIDLQAECWPELKPGEFAAPLYSTGTGEWRLAATPDARAFVVIRDPRDIVVSLVFSLSLSHTPSNVTLLLRDPIANATPGHRLRMGMFLLAHWADDLRTWKDAGEFSNVHLTRYETLIADLPGELRRLFEFLHWDVPPSVINEVSADSSFEQRSGRKPGDENEFSHRRKGIAGDWQNHFDRELGQLFENAFPALLTDLGFAADNDWWRSLPLTIPDRLTNGEERLSLLLAVLREHETELAAVRLAARERLRDVELLHAQLHEQRNAAEERLRVIGELDRQLNVVTAQRQIAQVAADQRLADILRRESARQELESGVAWRRGFRPLHAIVSLLRK